MCWSQSASRIISQVTWSYFLDSLPRSLVRLWFLKEKLFAQDNIRNNKLRESYVKKKNTYVKIHLMKGPC